MTFEQVLRALRRQAVLILLVVVVAGAIASAYAALQTPVYSSTIGLRLSSLATSATASGQIGTAQVDFDPQSITSPTVLKIATGKLKEDDGALDDAVTYEAGTPGQSGASLLTITTTGATAKEAERRADAVQSAYSVYLQNQTQEALGVAQKAAADATATAEKYQGVPTTNVIAQANLQAAITQLNSANSTIAKITNAGAPLTVTRSASPGALQGVESWVTVAVALAAGLVAGIGIGLIRDQFDHRVRDDELERVSGLTALGDLTYDRRLVRSGGRLPAADRRLTALTEDLRALRTSIQVLLPRTGGVLVVTSVEPGDGKTFVAANLAVASARAGRKVVLVGGDLRRPALDRYVGDAADGPGLADLLERAAKSGRKPAARDVERALRPTGTAKLRVLPAGTEEATSPDLLASPALESILAALRPLCDLVIIDTPPALALSDASVLAVHADGAVLVTSLGRTDREHLVATVDALRTNGVAVLGAIGNRSRRRVPRSYLAYYRQASRSDDPGVVTAAEPQAGATTSSVPEPAPAPTPTVRAARPATSAATTRTPSAAASAPAQAPAEAVVERPESEGPEPETPAPAPDADAGPVVPNVEDALRIALDPARPRRVSGPSSRFAPKRPAGAPAEDAPATGDADVESVEQAPATTD